MAENEDKKEIRIRLLTVDKDSEVAYQRVHMHTIQLPTEISKSRDWKSYTCLKHEPSIDHDKFGYDCPFCEMNAYAFKEREKAIKEAEARGENPKDDPDVIRWTEISKAYHESEYSIMRLIERGDEAFGPKFLKVAHRSDGMDVEGQIRQIVKDKRQESIDIAKEENDGVLPEDFEPYNVLDFENGMDLKLTIERVYDKNNNPTKKTSIKVTAYGKPKPAAPDEETLDKWLDDEKIWSDVFVVKPYAYTSLIIDGKVPYFDKATGKWVAKDSKKAQDENSVEEAEDSNSEENATNVAYKEKSERDNVEAEDYNDEYDADEDEEALPF